MRLSAQRMSGTAAILLLLFLHTGFSQFKTKADRRPTVGESLIRTDGTELMFGWFDLNKFSMRQSYSLSYSSFGGKGLSLGEYTNSLAYQISDPLSVRFDVSLTHMPFNGFGSKLGQDLTGLRLSRAQLDYRPSENTLFQVQFRQIPATSYLRGWDMGFDFERPGEFIR